eukprot:TRINITY_DN35087_c0_g1_i1.p3 TRINITY_DN35087_c0_g1~~TRINITY_DN35087_c0_g1_i1.p3  ORF type:complete len:128 (+),score=12.61 TRINITY_DN35087_c0_g1_i1:35-418(+)
MNQQTSPPHLGEVAEWLKALPCQGSIGFVALSRVRIPPSPPLIDENPREGSTKLQGTILNVRSTARRAQDRTSGVILLLRHYFQNDACVAQLDRVPGCEPGGRRFETLKGEQDEKGRKKSKEKTKNK